MSAVNIATVTLINGKTSVVNVTDSTQNLVVNAPASSQVVKVNALYISNVDGTNEGIVTCSLVRSSTEYKLIDKISVPAASTLDVLSKHVYLEEGDSLIIYAAVTGILDAICSYEVLV